MNRLPADTSEATASEPEAAKTLLILGATGDLTARLLLPVVGGLVAGGGAEGLLLVGSAVDDWDDQSWRKRIAESFAEAGVHGAATDAVLSGARYVKADVTDADDFRTLPDRSA